MADTGSPGKIKATCSDGGTTSFERVEDQPQAIAVRFRSDRIELDLADGRTVATPLSFYPTLAAATSAQRRKWEYWPFAIALEWPEFDLQLSVESIVAGRREHVPPPGFRERTRAAMLKAGLKSPE